MSLFLNRFIRTILLSLITLVLATTKPYAENSFNELINEQERVPSVYKKSMRTFSKDGQVVAFSPSFDSPSYPNNDKFPIKLISTSNGREIGSIPPTQKKPFGTRPSDLMFSPDRKMVIYNISKGMSRKIKVRDVTTGNELVSFSGPSFIESDLSTSISPDSKILAASFENNNIHIFNLITQKEIGVISDNEFSMGRPSKLAFSPDGKLLASFKFSNSEKPYISIWNTTKLKIEKKLLDRTLVNFTPSSLAFSSDSNVLALGGPSEITLWDVSNQKLLTQIQTSGKNQQNLFHDNVTMAFSLDGKLLASTLGNQIILWDVTTGEKVKTLSGHLSKINDLSFLADGFSLMSSSDDGTVRKWNYKTGKEIVAFYCFEDGSYLTITPQGYFIASSPKAAKNLNVTKNGQIYSIDQFYDTFYRPDIVEAALSGADISSMVATTIDDAVKHSPPTIEKIEVPYESSLDKVKVAYKIKSNGGGIGDIRIFHNGKLVQSEADYRGISKNLAGKKTSEVTSELLIKEMRDIALKTSKYENFVEKDTSKPKGDIYESTLDIEPISGINDISIIAFNAQNSIQSTTKTVSLNSTKPQVPPKLYILSIGIDEYKDTTAKLNYAVKDSVDVASRWKTQAVKIYGERNVLVEKLSNTQANKEHILEKINEIATKVKPTDHFMFFVASHGVLFEDQYYMVTNDYDGALQSTKLIGSNEIVGFSKKIKALSQLYILDTCHAGGVEGVVSGLYDARVSVLAKKMGLHIFASASSEEAALDGFKGNGLFTYNLLLGLGNNKQADLNSDTKITISELGKYSKTQTKEVATKISHKQDPIILNFGLDNLVYKLQ